jgi:hypothetical protein
MSDIKGGCAAEVRAAARASACALARGDLERTVAMGAMRLFRESGRASAEFAQLMGLYVDF